MTIGLLLKIGVAIVVMLLIYYFSLSEDQRKQLLEKTTIDDKLSDMVVNMKDARAMIRARSSIEEIEKHVDLTNQAQKQVWEEIKKQMALKFFEAPGDQK